MPAEFFVEPFARIQFSDGFERKGGNATFAISGAVYGGVVNDDHMTIGGKFRVQFNAIGAFLDGLLKSGQGIFRRVGFVTAMREK